MSLKYSKFHAKNNLVREPTNAVLVNRKSASFSAIKPTIKKDVPKVDEKFICKFDPADKHLYKNNARILPCNNIACTDCIKKFMDVSTGVLHCNLCTNDHRILNIQYLQVDPNLVISMDKNKAFIGEDLLQQMRFFLDQLVSKSEQK
jgi:hypothetical protein